MNLNFKNGGMKLKNRYNNKNEVKVGDRIMFDNKTGFIRDLLKVKLIGDVIDTELDDNLIKISFNVNGIKEPLIKDVPYFLCQ